MTEYNNNVILLVYIHRSQEKYSIMPLCGLNKQKYLLNLPSKRNTATNMKLTDLSPILHCMIDTDVILLWKLYSLHLQAVTLSVITSQPGTLKIKTTIKILTCAQSTYPCVEIYLIWHPNWYSRPTWIPRWHKRLEIENKIYLLIL